MKITAQMNESHSTCNRVEEVISMLRSLTYKGGCVDGETMQYILERVGMSDQMLRQLVMSQPIKEVEYMVEERIQLEQFLVKCN